MRLLVIMVLGCRASLGDEDLLLAFLLVWSRCEYLGDQLRTVVSGVRDDTKGLGASCGTGIPDVAFARSRIHRTNPLASDGLDWFQYS